IEYMLKDSDDDQLTRLSLSAFADETASESPAPGGGSVAAYVGSLGAALAAMVANLTAQKKEWDLFGSWAEKATACKKELLALVDADTKAFEAIMAARGLPKTTAMEKAFRAKAMETATINAIEVPWRVMKTSFRSMEVIEAMAKDGNPNS